MFVELSISYADGYRKGLYDERGQLFLYLLDILDYYHPKYIVFENVQKLSTIKRGKLLSEMEIALQEIGPGYHLHTWDLLASDYGLPQKRYRIFFCGIRRDLSERKDLNEPPKVDLNNIKYPTTWHLLEKRDQRPLVKRPTPKNKLTEDERNDIIKVVNNPEYATLHRHK